MERERERLRKKKRKGRVQWSDGLFGGLEGSGRAPANTREFCLSIMLSTNQNINSTRWK